MLAPTLFRKIILLLIAAIVSIGLVFSIPLINFFRYGSLHKNESYKTEVTLLQQEKREELKIQKREIKRPERREFKSRTLKSTPRFAMDLGVAGVGGVAVPSDLINKSSRASSDKSSGDVDQRPQAKQMPDFELPKALREREQDAFVLISFCVDATGTPYDFRVTEERPVGFGLADAGKRSLNKVRFEPAQKGGRAVAFCGMEQPFEDLFTN